MRRIAVAPTLVPPAVTFCRRCFSALILLILLPTLSAQGTDDEPLRLHVLAAIFPNMEVEPIARRFDSTIRLDVRPSLVFPDWLALAPAYRITGAPTDDRERCAARDLTKRTTTSERELRFRVFPWPGAARGELLAILQYRFMGAEPPGSCPSLAELYRLAPSKGKDNWKVVDRFPLDAAHHNHIESVQFVRVTGESDVPEMVIESDSGDGVRFESDLHVLMLAHGRFQELLNVPSRLHMKGEGDQWTQTLDVARTLEHHGEQFCFEKSIWAAGHRRFAAPEISHPCYPRQ